MHEGAGVFGSESRNRSHRDIVEKEQVVESRHRSIRDIMMKECAIGSVLFTIKTVCKTFKHL